MKTIHTKSAPITLLLLYSNEWMHRCTGLCNETVSNISVKTYFRKLLRDFGITASHQIMPPFKFRYTFSGQCTSSETSLSQAYLFCGRKKKDKKPFNHEDSIGRRGFSRTASTVFVTDESTVSSERQWHSRAALARREKFNSSGGNCRHSFPRLENSNAVTERRVTFYYQSDDYP